MSFFFILKDENAILTQLQNHAARLKNIKHENIKYYYDTLVEAKEIKEQALLNRVSINSPLTLVFSK